MDESARKCDRSLGDSFVMGELLAEVGLCARRLLRERPSRTSLSGRECSRLLLRCQESPLGPPPPPLFDDRSNSSSILPGCSLSDSLVFECLSLLLRLERCRLSELAELERDDDLL